MTEIKTLRPGLLVSLHTSLRGNVHYQTQGHESGVREDGAHSARWETTRVISDPKEHEDAIKVRSKIRSLITSVCALSAFGLLCPEDKADELFASIREARELADTFNETASLSRIQVNVIYGRIAQDDVEAVRAIAGEIRQLMEDMQNGLKNLDVKAVRDACNKAKSVGEMLSPDARARTEVAIEAARKAARRIVKAGNEVAVEIDRSTMAAINMARTSFLDIESEAAAVASPTFEGRALDLMGV